MELLRRDRMIYDLPVENPGLRELYPVFAGCQTCEGGHSFGPAVRNYYLLHYIRAGRGKFRYENTVYSLSAGQCFLICPQDVTFYQADSRDPWSYTWLAFNGDAAEKLIACTGLGKQNPVFSSEAVSEVFLELTERILHIQTENENTAYYLLSRLYMILYCLPYLWKESDSKDRYVEKARKYIASLYSRQITVDDVARLCGLNRHYLSRIFKEKTGFTLQDYLLKTRLEHAYALIITSTLSIGEIARSVGYADVYNFSKMFKKRYETAPLNLRKIYIANRNGGENGTNPLL